MQGTSGRGGGGRRDVDKDTDDDVDDDVDDVLDGVIDDVLDDVSDDDDDAVDDSFDACDARSFADSSTRRSGRRVIIDDRCRATRRAHALTVATRACIVVSL